MADDMIERMVEAGRLAWMRAIPDDGTAHKATRACIAAALLVASKGICEQPAGYEDGIIRIVMRNLADRMEKNAVNGP